jgi:hypothetical protein
VTDQLDYLHAQAGLNLLRADSALTVVPDLEGNVPAELPDRYVRVYTDVSWPDSPEGRALDSRSATCTTRYYTHAVGPNEVSALIVAGRVRAALLDQRPTVTGRVVGMIRQEVSNPPTRDESTGVAVFDAVRVYVLQTQP